MTALTGRIERTAHELGFDLVGVAPVGIPSHLAAYREWVARGYHGEMGYLARPDRIARRADPTLILPGVRSIACVALNYYNGDLPEELTSDPSRGIVSRYAWGEDYHQVLLDRLEALADSLRAEGAFSGAHRAYVDTGPLLERSLAVQAGLGFIGKNTCLIHPRLGSWLFLGELLLDVELEPSGPLAGVGCGTCRRCLEACPTGALVTAHLLDARRCISYLTIEFKGAVPRELRPLLGNRVFGCDVCQEVCPWQRFSRPTQEATLCAPGPNHAAPLLTDLIALDQAGFRQRYARTPVWRARRRGLLRNVAVALGNWGDERALPALTRALADDEPLVRGHAAWALGRIPNRNARRALETAWQREEDISCREEIGAALAG